MELVNKLLEKFRVLYT